MRTVDVSLGARSYPIFIGPNLLPRLGQQCAKFRLGRRCAVVSDQNVARLHAKPVLAGLQAAGFEPALITVPAGETSKSLRTVQACCDHLARHRLERNSFIVALGGGVVGDLAGFLAAIYLRGIAFVQAPTTLLAQVDSSVGGKVGVNLNAGKNLVGAFHQPRFVLCDLTALDSLPAREFRAGLAEVIKYGIIYDAAPVRAAGTRPAAAPQARPVRAGRESWRVAAKSKPRSWRQDETESGVRAILNFGHTIGHAIEAISGYGKFLHGEAISIGQVAAAKLSVEVTGLPVGGGGRASRRFFGAPGCRPPSNFHARAAGRGSFERDAAG